MKEQYKKKLEEKLRKAMIDSSLNKSGKIKQEFTKYELEDLYYLWKHKSDTFYNGD